MAITTLNLTYMFTGHQAKDIRKCKLGQLWFSIHYSYCYLTTINYYCFLYNQGQYKVFQRLPTKFKNYQGPCFYQILMPKLNTLV